MDIQSLQQEISNVVQKFELTKECLNLKSKNEKLQELLKERESLSFWSNVDMAMSVNKEIKSIQSLIDNVNRIQKEISDIIDLKALYNDQTDLTVFDEVYRELLDIKEQVEELNVRTLLNDKYDNCNAIVSIHAGAGGTEALDWARMLFRMYTMYCDKNHFDYVITDILENEIGIKSVTFIVKGEYAYGFLNGEKGVHRLVRISPFDAQKRRHTTFASVDVIPELKSDYTIKFAPDELKIDTYRSQGAGGQNVNKTDSAVRITHLPTNIVVTCQNERSQLQNREMALKILTCKLIAMKEEEHNAKLNQIKGELKKIEWGSQIRSYVFQPYTMVKDHRTDYETNDIESVMDGNLTDFINEYLKKANKKVENPAQ